MQQESAIHSYRDYGEFARALYETGVISDPWLDGNERFDVSGVVLNARRARALSRAAERVAYLHQELVEILLNEPALIGQFYHLTPVQQAMWQSAGGLWHGMARADLFICEDGRIRCCELNSDTPSGQPEAVLLNKMLRAAHGNVRDPNHFFGRRFIEMLRASLAKRDSNLKLESVGILYPTELTEDLGMITLFRQWLESEGINVVVGSPFNLRHTGKGIELLGTKVDLIVRHYKTDWWGERRPVWADSPDFPDPEPLYGPLGALLAAELEGQVTVVNPFGSVLTQNKFSLAFFWEEQERFSPRAQKWIREYIPETCRMTSLPSEQLKSEQSQWVLKSDYGCEGDETVCGPFVSDELWRKSVEQALPGRFVAQKFFHVARDVKGRLPNYGVYLLGGRAAGYFTRLSPQSTGYEAVTVPTFVARA